MKLPLSISGSGLQPHDVLTSVDMDHGTKPAHPVDSFAHRLLTEASPHVSQQEKQAYLSRSDYQQVRTQGYEKDLLTPQGQVVHALNTIYVDRAIQQLRAKHASLSVEAFDGVLEKTFPDFLQEGLATHQLDLSYYKPVSVQKRGYARYLLYAHPDKIQPFCFQLFVFGPGQKTRLHNHMAPCACQDPPDYKLS